MKYWGLSWDEVMWRRSIMNIQMLGMSIPKYDEKGELKTTPKKEEMSGADLFQRFKR